MSKTAAHDAAATEAKGISEVVVTWRDLSLTVPTFDNWPVEVLEVAETGREIATLRLILGDKQWQQFKSAVPAPVRSDVLALSKMIGEASVGASDLGESGASSDS